MSSTTNTYNTTKSADYLNEMRQYITQQKAGQTGQQNITQMQVVPIVPEIMQMTDTVVVNDAAHSQTLADSMNMSDTVTNTTANTGTWEFPMDSNNDTSVLNPILAVGEFDVAMK